MPTLRNLRRYKQNYLTRTKNIYILANASHQIRLDTRSKARRPIKMGIKGRGRSGTSRDSNPACLCCSSAHLVQCEPDEVSSFTNPNMGPSTYASLWLKLTRGLVPYVGYKGDKSAARPPEGSQVETRSLKPQVCHCSFGRATLQTEVQNRPRGVLRYKKEQIEYIQVQINKSKNMVEDRTDVELSSTQ